ncbi:MAG TPA: T9SS type A sorting domain-containing protein [Bacteroidia bacterium]|jgi:hypothetical protein|nr:T9SS type A sorting domain-containing protein [Bacteroidia bacterium]
MFYIFSKRFLFGEKKCLFLGVVFLCVVLSVKSQNLVPNPSFEFDTGCSNGYIYYAVPWINPTTASPDLYDTCNTFYCYDIPVNCEGEEATHSGAAYAGIITKVNLSSNYAEYIQVKLLDSLFQGHNYCVKYYSSLAGRSEYATIGPQVFISDNPISSPFDTILIANPQIESSTIIGDTTNWTLITGVYSAHGGESYLTIGNFYGYQTNMFDSVGSPGNSVAYYYIDDVSVTECDTTDTSTHYSTFTIFPSPTPNGQFHLTGNFPSQSRLHIYNMLGQEVAQPMELPEGNNSVPVFLPLAEGVYMWRIAQGKEIIYTSKFEIVK